MDAPEGLAATAEGLHTDEGRARLRRARILVVGAGGLGVPILLYMAAAGVGEIVLFDDDEIEEGNLARQLLYNREDLGQSKAAIAKDKLAAQFPSCVTTAHATRFTTETAGSHFRDSTLVLDASDNLETRLLLNELAVKTETPLITGAVGGFFGQITTIYPSPSHSTPLNEEPSPCYRCLFPELKQDPPREAVGGCVCGGDGWIDGE